MLLATGTSDRLELEGAPDGTPNMLLFNRFLTQMEEWELEAERGRPPTEGAGGEGNVAAATVADEGRAPTPAPSLRAMPGGRRGLWNAQLFSFGDQIRLG